VLYCIVVSTQYHVIRCRPIYWNQQQTLCENIFLDFVASGSDLEWLFILSGTSHYRDAMRRSIARTSGLCCRKIVGLHKNLFHTTKYSYLLTTFRRPSDILNLDNILLTVYSSMEHVIWKSHGPMCGWVGRILRPDSCTGSSWCKMPPLSIWFADVPLCRPLLPNPSRWRGSLPEKSDEIQL